MDKKVDFSKILLTQCKEILHFLDKVIVEEEKELKDKLEKNQEETVYNTRPIKIFMGEGNLQSDFYGKTGEIQEIKYEIEKTSMDNLRVTIFTRNFEILGRTLVGVLGGCIRAANIRKDGEMIYAHIVFPIKCKKHFENCDILNSLLVFII